MSDEESSNFDYDFVTELLLAGRPNIPQKMEQSDSDSIVESENDDENDIPENSQSEEDDVGNSLKSKMWSHYIRLDNGIAAQCKICDKVIKTTNGSTSGMWRHMRNVHKEVVLPSPKETIKEQDIVYMKSNSEEAIKITQKIAMFIIKDLHSYNTVDGLGFVELIHHFQPNYKIPARTTFSRNVIPKIYETMKTKIKEQILQDIETSKVKVIYLTTDGYTSRAIDGFISLTLHYAVTNFKLQHYTLCVENMPENKTSINLNEFLNKKLLDWGLESAAIQKIFITDGAPNIVGAIAMTTTWTRIPCFDHLLQLAIKDVETSNDYLDGVISKAKKIVGHFKRSTVSSLKLKEAQETISPNEKALKVIQHVETRWNSKYIMLNRILVLRTPICMTLTGRGMPENFTNEEWNVIETYVKILSPVKQVTTMMEGDQYPTLSSYIPMVRGLLSVLEYDETASDDENDLAEQYRSSIEQRFNFVNENDTLITAMMIDPRYKDRFLEESSKQFAFEILLRKTKELNRESSSTQHQNIPNCASRNIDTGEPLKKLRKFFDQARINDEAKNPPNSEADRECLLFLKQNVIEVNSCPLTWWSENQKDFSQLAIVAQHFLSGPATQASSERLFSTVGNIVTPKRIQMLTEHVEEITFCHENVM